MSLYLAYASHPSEPSSCRFQAPHFNKCRLGALWKLAVVYCRFIEHNTYIEKAALHLSINRGRKSIVTRGARAVQGWHFCEPRGGSTRTSWSRARVHQPGTAGVFQQLPTVGSCQPSLYHSSREFSTDLHTWHGLFEFQHRSHSENHKHWSLLRLVTTREDMKLFKDYKEVRIQVSLYGNIHRLFAMWSRSHDSIVSAIQTANKKFRCGLASQLLPFRVL